MNTENEKWKMDFRAELERVEKIARRRIKIKMSLLILKYRFSCFLVEEIPRKIAMRLPRKVVYHAIIRAWAYSTTHSYPHLTPDECTWDMVLRDSDKF